MLSASFCCARYTSFLHLEGSFSIDVYIYHTFSATILACGVQYLWHNGFGNPIQPLRPLPIKYSMELSIAV
jgi:hypothetical protein